MKETSMKYLVAALAVAMAPAFAQAPAGKPARKPAPGVNKKLAHSAQKAVEEVTPVDADPDIKLTDAELEIAKKVYVGEIPCELGAKISIKPLKRGGFVMITAGKYRFAMHPVESRTGAISLEDPKRGAMWLQLGNKSMLMSQKLGQRLADECQSPEQITFAEKLKANPINILEAPKPVPTTMPPPAAAPASAAASKP